MVEDMQGVAQRGLRGPLAFLTAVPVGTSGCHIERPASLALQVTEKLGHNPLPVAFLLLIVHLTHSRPPPPVAGRLVAGRGIAPCPSVAVNGGGTGESTGIAG